MARVPDKRRLSLTFFLRHRGGAWQVQRVELGEPLPPPNGGRPYP